MINKVIISGLVIFASYIRSESSDKKYKAKDTIRNTSVSSSTVLGMRKTSNQNDVLSAHIDKVEILCFFFGKHNDNSFNIFLSNSEFIVFRPYNKKDTIYVGRNKNKEKLIEFVNQLYIDKTDKIILNKTKRNCLKSTDYPYIKVVCYRNKKKFFDVETQIGEEEYDIEFNPKFLEFCEFLDSLVKEK